MLAVGLALALAVGSAAPAAAAPPPPAPAGAEDENLVSELLVIARRVAPDPSAVTTACLWRELPAAERDGFSREVGRALATLTAKPPHRPDRSVVTEAGAGVALRACGAPAEPEALPFARVAVTSYAVERAAAERLGAMGLSEARLARAWDALPSADREILAAQTGRLARGLESEPDEAAMVVFGLIRRLRPLSAFNPLAYKSGSMNQLIVVHYASRAVRHAMEKRF